MATFYEEIVDSQIDFIQRQHIFFTATSHGEGRVNLSPKGMDTFRVLDSTTVAYLDMIGSGNETAAHLQNDGRITLMFCSFDQDPNILRLYGHGEAIGPSNEKWSDIIKHFDEIHGQRQLIVATIDSTQDSCGWAIPRYDYLRERDTLREYSKKATPELLQEKIASQTTSIDGLPITPSA